MARQVKNKQSKKSNVHGKVSDALQSDKKRMYRKKKNIRKIRKMKRKKLLWQMFFSVVGSIIIVIFSVSFFYSLTLVKGYSMIPMYDNNDLLLVKKTKKIKRFDLVCFKIPGEKKTSVRRVIGLPGESVEYRQDQLYIDNKEVFERFLVAELEKIDQLDMVYTSDFKSDQLTYDSFTKKSDLKKYLVLGDNRPYSTDSRYYGVIDEDMIIGIIEAKIWP
ncbi:signal peptidase I [Candidatus Enterococcus mansonii]|uniref:Signal peptidase I n=1 Tax=Candidatus Enterococcus mansonii TaxID=1834181 RepID=A0A242CE13_9ENTE|nr:signal peptidase I [Enterococcus sp. 4G2_DIV0659]OTO08160.1 signal peptidase I [Enterococcus sp. 4G2_DIV0659]